ncbi:hypothetical protein L6452_05973 [Arctium lappa]|uniref:Uncharacterized protein n=1 Tax=Arctium lappa TaxID=4217 RepID=A0ACB9EIX9_ARCLA|nr:hypothetical protein L6452_05973 [Arctium lappa]
MSTASARTTEDWLIQIKSESGTQSHRPQSVIGKLPFLDLDSRRNSAIIVLVKPARLAFPLPIKLDSNKVAHFATCPYAMRLDLLRRIPEVGRWIPKMNL